MQETNCKIPMNELCMRHFTAFASAFLPCDVGKLLQQGESAFGAPTSWANCWLFMFSACTETCGYFQHIETRQFGRRVPRPILDSDTGGKASSTLWASAPCTRFIYCNARTPKYWNLWVISSNISTTPQRGLLGVKRPWVQVSPLGPVKEKSS